MKPQDTIQFDEKGLVPVITQDYSSNEILMMAWMNKEALELSIETKKAVYFSRSRKKLWFKGEESGNYQDIIEIFTDCDQDVVYLRLIKKVGLLAILEEPNASLTNSMIINGKSSQM
jgi:phosphoribosyl-AMP cyclohydrolase